MRNPRANPGLHFAPAFLRQELRDSWRAPWVRAAGFSSIDTNEFLSRPVGLTAPSQTGGGWFGVLSYDDFCVDPRPGAMRGRGAVSDVAAKSRIYRVDRLEPYLPGSINDGGNALSLVPRASGERHRDLISTAIESIRSGRFYQVNLLRYFDVSTEGDAHASLTRRLNDVRPPWGFALEQVTDDIDDDALCIVSFSPERFVQVLPHAESGEMRVATWPIKGTMPRDRDPARDAVNAEQLLSSPKDLAELHMIVDLLRNDLLGVCRLGSVEVMAPHRLKSFSHVHHLESEIAGTLRPRISWGEFFSTLLPGGSVTGAPKIEVMQAIREAEERNRGFFMGTAFWLDDSGELNSSILIRTAVRSSAGRSYEYAAGSGITVRSIPELEVAEVAAKCSVVGAILST